MSVLLDAGAGNDWKYRESPGDVVVERSEGLAVASLHMFVDGAFGDGESGVVSGKLTCVVIAKLLVLLECRKWAAKIYGGQARCWHASEPTKSPHRSRGKSFLAPKPGEISAASHPPFWRNWEAGKFGR